MLPSDGGGTRHFELGRELVRRGWDVTVVASDYHPQRRAYTRRADADNHGPIDETVEGVRFRWLWAASYKSNDWRRAINWLTFHRSIASMRDLPTRPDVVIGSSPQLFAATAARKLARRLRVPFVFEVRDLWPEGLLAAGGKKGLAYVVMRRVSSGLYRDANRIMVLAAGVARYLTERGTDPARIFHVPNGVDVDLVKPVRRAERPSSNGSGRKTLIYAGAHGPMNGLDIVIEAAAILAASDTPVRFVLVGDGPLKNDLVAAVSSRRLENVEFVDPLPKKELAKMLAHADAGLMLLRDAAMFSYAVSPNKLFDYLSAGIPVICNVPGETADLLAASGAGIQTRDTSAQALVDA
ncbi:MAG TPA: glycosyltransferase family 4 protein, partial [Gemmatimonadaceae bacterium]